MKTTLPLVLLTILILCMGCTGPTPAPTVVPTSTPLPPTPSPTPEPIVLTVCMPDEPESLYLYATQSMATQHVWQAIYDGPVDMRNYGYQPVILTDLPTFTNGGATIKTVDVETGERVLAANNQVVQLTPGVMIEDTDGNRVTFDTTPISMVQMVVTYTLYPDLYWSDGALLTADDSVYSFELAADPATPVDKHIVERTADYRAAGVRTAVWTGVPGFVDHAYLLNFYHPLPRHAWEHLPAADLLTAEVAARKPLGWGPFVLQEWVPGDHITAARNPLYFRSPEGLPRVDRVIFRFIPDPTVLAEELLTERCDVVTHEAADGVRAALPAPAPPPPEEQTGQGEPESESGPTPAPLPVGQIPGGSVALSTYDARWELIGFGISPAPDYARPDFFEDVRVRQALALCIDRQALVDRPTGPPSRVSHSYLPPEHPLYGGDVLTTWGYAPAAAQTLLATAGWYDEDGDGVREAHNVPGIADGTPFQITYRTTDDPLRTQTGQLVQTYLADCGIGIELQITPAETLFGPGPEGVLFGRRFDLVQFSWRATPVPLCDMFMSDQVPASENWQRPNVMGFLDDTYDVACLSASQALPDSQVYAAGHVEAQRIFSERLPALPLFQRLKVTMARDSVIGLVPDSTQLSELWNIEQLETKP